MRGEAFAQLAQANGVDEVIAAILEFPSGVLGHIDASLRAQQTHTYGAWLTGAHRGRPRLCAARAGNAHSPLEGRQPPRIHPAACQQYQYMVEDFADALLNQRPPRFAPQGGGEHARGRHNLGRRANVE